MGDTKYIVRNMRKNILEMALRAKASHVACSLSTADIIAVLFNDFMQISPDRVLCDARPRFIMSKGHAAMVVYAGLREFGLLSSDDLLDYCTDGSPLAGHVSHHVPGVDASTGALGHGLSIGCGLALSCRNDGLDCATYVVMGDGETNEGAVWEAAQFAATHRLGNLVAIIDSNKLQGYGRTEDILDQENLADRFNAFGWHTVRIDGHSHTAIRRALSLQHPDKPLAVVADTIKGKGVTMMEGDNVWHYRPPNEAQVAEAIRELSNA